MKRLTLLLLLATTATCRGQSSEQILHSIGSSDMSAGRVVTEPIYMDVPFTHLVKLNIIERSIANNTNYHPLLVKVDICLAGTRHRPIQRRQRCSTVAPRMITINQVATSTNPQNKMM